MSVEAFERPDAHSPWTREAVSRWFDAPFADLLFHAQSVHRAHFDPNQVQISRLVSIKTGGCPEDCGYCSQSAHYKTGIKPTKLMALEDVVAAARAAKAAGTQRLCLGAAWRSPRARDLELVCEMIGAIKAEGLETCVTLGMLDAAQAQRLAEAGLDYYNHNIDTSPEYYDKVITTRTFQDRLDTLEAVREAGLKVCCGGILGMGETLEQRAEFAADLAELDPHEVPLNFLNPRPGTPFGDLDVLPASEALRAVAAFRLALPRTMLRFAGGREITLGDLGAKKGILGGINAVIVGNYLTTLGRPAEADLELLDDLQMPIKALNASL